MGRERVVLIDGSGLVYRAWHALPSSLKTSQGLHTNAILGFARMFRKILAGRKPTMGAVVFDAGRRTFRTRLDPNYKAHRPPMKPGLREQLPWIDKLVEAHNFPMLRVPDVEADDVIATLATQAHRLGHDVLIVSGDKDFAQLVQPGVRLFDPTKEVTYDAERVFKRWGVHPHQFVDYLAMVGDKADNIPGVRGIGEQGAIRLLADHGTLASARQDNSPMGLRLAEQWDQALHSKELATLLKEVVLPRDVADLRVVFPTPEQLNTLYRTLEFYSLLTAEAPVVHAAEYFICDTQQMAANAINAECTTGQVSALFGLWEFPGPSRGDLVGLAISPSPGRAFYLPFRGPGTTLGAGGLRLIQPWIEHPDLPKVCHNAKEVWVALEKHGLTLQGLIGDTALASFRLDPTLHLPHRLEQVARQTLHRGLQPVRGVVGSGRNQRRFSELTVDKAGAYACHLADAVASTWPVLRQQLRERAELSAHTRDDLPMVPVLGRMERTGIRLDAAPLHALGRQFRTERDQRAEAIFRHAGRRFNPGSLKQLGTVLFEDLKLPVLGRTKSGYKLTREILDALEPKHPIVGELLRWRTLNKLINTYTDVLLAAVHEDGRIHPTFQLTTSATGRLISTEPDLQRTPVRTPEFRAIRSAVVPSEGHQLISADWSQVELRVLAHFSQDPVLLAAYREGVDLHRITAAQLFHLPLHEVDERQRSVGKTVNFATIYGQGATALATQLKISRGEATRYIDTFFSHYAGVRDWRDRIVSQAHRDGFVTTLSGRRRRIPELSTRNFSDRSHGERIAMNTPIQGTVADLCKTAMVTIDQQIQARGLAARMVLQIHDELLIDTPSAEVDAVKTLVKAAMENAAQLSVPLVVRLKTGQSWAET